MDKNEFINHINNITKETKSPLLYHRTKLSNLESILKDGALLPLKYRTEENFNLGSLGNMRKDVREKYINSIFLTMKTPNNFMKKENFFIETQRIKFKDETRIIQEEDEVIFLINPYNIKEEIFQDSFLCYEWRYGRFSSIDCRKWIREKDTKYNFKRWETFMDKKYDKRAFKKYNDNELVIRNPKGINFNDILSINSKGIMIVIKTNKKESEFRDIISLMDKYPQYQYIFILYFEN